MSGKKKVSSDWKNENRQGVLDIKLKEVMEATPKDQGTTWTAWLEAVGDPELAAFSARTIQAMHERLEAEKAKPTVANAGPRAPLTAVVVNGPLKRPPTALMSRLGTSPVSVDTRFLSMGVPKFRGVGDVGPFASPYRAPAVTMSATTVGDDAMFEAERSGGGLTFAAGEATFGGFQDFTGSNQNPAFIAYMVVPDSTTVEARVSMDRREIEIYFRFPELLPLFISAAIPSDVPEFLSYPIKTKVAQVVADVLSNQSCTAKIVLTRAVKMSTYRSWKTSGGGFKTLLFTGSYEVDHDLVHDVAVL